MKDYFDDELLPVVEPVPEPVPVPASPVPAPLASAELVDKPVEPWFAPVPLPEPVPEPLLPPAPPVGTSPLPGRGAVRLLLGSVFWLPEVPPLIVDPF